MNNLPLVNIIQKPYEIWEERHPTYNEMMNGKTGLQKERLIARINNHYDAARYELHHRGCTKLDRFIENELNNSLNYQAMRQMMPSKTDKILSDFQNKFQSTHFDKVSAVVNRDGKPLAEGQILYHGGGFWLGKVNEEVVTSRPLSTSFSPHMACQNADWGGKTYDAGELHLMMIRAVDPRTNAFCFRINGTSKGHEKEVLLAAGAKLILRKKTLIKSDGLAYKSCHVNAGRVLKKTIPFYLLEMDIS